VRVGGDGTSEAESLGPGKSKAMRVRAAAGAQLKARSQFCEDGGDTSRCEWDEGGCEDGDLMGCQGQEPVASGESILSRASRKLGWPARHSDSSLHRALSPQMDDKHQSDPATEELAGTDFGCGRTTTTESSGRRASSCSLRLRW
jgi:hypothetical protein